MQHITMVMWGHTILKIAMYFQQVTLYRITHGWIYPTIRNLNKYVIKCESNEKIEIEREMKMDAHHVNALSECIYTFRATTLLALALQHWKHVLCCHAKEKNLTSISKSDIHMYVRHHRPNKIDRPQNLD